MSATLKMAKVRSLGMQGDPGLGNIIGGLVRKVTSVGKAIGIPGFGAANTVANVILPPRNSPPNALPALLSPPQIMRGQPIRNLPLLPGGGMQIQQDLGARGALTKSGQPRRIRRDGKFFKRPAMNFANGRAIKRAARRLEGAEKMFRRVFSIRHGAVKGKILPKRAR